jgi:hypothetical protein
MCALRRSPECGGHLSAVVEYMRRGEELRPAGGVLVVVHGMVRQYDADISRTADPSEGRELVCARRLLPEPVCSDVARGEEVPPLIVLDRIDRENHEVATCRERHLN